MSGNGRRPARKLRGVAIGAGYFSQFHYDAWQRVPEVELVALCDRDLSKAQATAARFGVPRVYADLRTLLDEEKPDFIDVITPPETHLEVCAEAAARGIHIICQKALAPTFAEASELVELVESAGIRFMVHENFRFQPWHREIRALIDAGTVGKVHSISARTRMGDGWGEDAYLSRQPYFRTMPRLLLFETGIHFIDVFRFLGGEVSEVYARLRRLNPVIAGEDTGLLMLSFESGAVALWDANRYNESLNADPRYTFGEFLVEGEQGSIRLFEDGRILLHSLGEQPRAHEYFHERRGFAGDCCFLTIRHFVDRLLDGNPFETGGTEYLKSLAVLEATYCSAAQNRPIAVTVQEVAQANAGS